MRSFGFKLSMYAGLMMLPLLLTTPDGGAMFPDGLAVAQNKKDDEAGGPPRKTKKTPTLRKQIYEKLNEAQIMMESEPPDMVGAKKLVEQVRGMKELKPYELAQMWNFYAYMHYSEGNTKKAIESYNQVLAQPELPEAMQIQTIYTLAQLHFADEQYQKSIDMMNRWFSSAVNPGPEPYIILGQAYYQLGQFQNALVPVETAIRLAKEKGKPVKENWLLLLRVFYYELNDYPKVASILEELLQSWPKKEYWVQLAGMYGELDKEVQQVAAYEIAHLQGFFTQERELVQMAQLYMSQDVPYKAAKVLEKGMSEGKIERSGKNMRLIAQAWAMSKDDDKAVPALKEAARLTGDSELYVRLAQSYINMDEWKMCVDALQTALNKGGLKRTDQARIMLGMAQFNLNQLTPAEKTFQLAAQDRRSAKAARQWIAYIQSERKRKAELAAALR